MRSIWLILMLLQLARGAALRASFGGRCWVIRHR